LTLTRGMWIVEPPSIALRDDYLERLQALKLEEHLVMIDGPKPGLVDRTWSTEALGKFAAATKAWGARRALSAWAAPQAAAIGELRARLPEAVSALEASAVELDDEEVWRKSYLQGYASLDLAGGALASAIRQLGGGIAYEFTTYPALLKRVLSAGRHADRLTIQVYSTSARQGQPIAYDGSLGPLRFPREGIEAARAELHAQQLDRIEVVAGLAAYRQQWHSHTDTEAMYDALESALGALRPGPEHVRYWSSAFLAGPKRIAARATWLASTKLRAS